MAAKAAFTGLFSMYLRFDSSLRELKKTQDLRQRGAIIRALGSFRDPKLVAAALDLVIHSDIDTRETTALLYSGINDPATERMPFEFVKANYDEILKRRRAAAVRILALSCRIPPARFATRHRRVNISISSASARRNSRAVRGFTSRRSKE